MFNIQKFQERRAGRFGRELFYYPEIESTNNIAAEKAKERIEEGSIVFADSQTNGRGRGNHHWFSPADVNLYFTVILYPENAYLHYLPFLSGLAISDVLERQGIATDLKWPNDILAQGRKIAGILIQTCMEENRLQYALVGIGMNLNVESFPPELASNAISASQILNYNVDREEFLASVLAELERLYKARLSWVELSERVTHHSSYINGCDVEVTQDGKTIRGKSAGLDPTGGLILQTSTGTEIIYAGEVSSCRKN